MCISHHYRRPRADCPLHLTQLTRWSLLNNLNNRLKNFNTNVFSSKPFFLHFYTKTCTELKESPCLQYWYLREWQWSQAWASPGVNISLLPVYLCQCLNVSQQINLNHFSAHPVITVTLCYTVTWHPVLDVSGIFSRWLKLPEAGICGSPSDIGKWENHSEDI